MRRLAAFIYSILFACSAYGQNLVSNPSFEQYANCPLSLQQSYGYSNVTSWIHGSNTSPLYFNACATGSMSGNADVPNNSAGFQAAYDGNGYGGFFAHGNGTNLRSFLHGNVSTLQTGSYYKVSINVSLSECSMGACAGIGAYFYHTGTWNYVNINTNFMFGLTPQVDYTSFGIISDTTTWVTLTDTLYADSAYTHIIIGNFKNDANTSSTLMPGYYYDGFTNYYWNGAVYYIDYVTVEQIVTPPLTMSITSTNVSCNGGNNGTATATAQWGIPPYTYLWSNGQTSQTAVNLTAGTYTCTVTDAANNTITQSVTITQPPALVATIASSTAATCGVQNGSAMVSVSGGVPGYTYAWSPYGGTSATATGLGAGTYVCTVMDLNGCVDTAQVTIGQTSGLTLTPSVSNANCYGQSNGSAIVVPSGGAGPFSYLWSNGQTTQTATSLAAGTYTVTVTDANSCTATATVTIGQPTQLNAAISNAVHVNCYGQSTGTAIANASGGTPGYSYLWSNGQTSQTATGLAAGTYTCTVTDANGCIATATVTINQPPQLTVTITGSTSTSCAQSNGSATVSVSGGTPGYGYSWSPYGGNAATATGLGAGVYTVTVTDSKGCVATAQVTIATSTPLNVTAATIPVSCYGGSNGSATASVSGGNGSYTYNWSNGQTTQTATSLAAGSYSITVTDVNGCAGSATLTVTQPIQLNATISNTINVNCYGQSTGSATVTATGGTPGYTYLWNSVPQQTTATAINLSAGTYTVTITDNNGCTTTAQAVITQNPALTAMIVSSANATCSQNNGTATVAASGGTGPYTYNWSNGGITATIGNLAAGNYSVTVTDAYNCTATASVTITQSSALSLSVAATDVSCYGLSDGSAMVTIGAGTPPYTYNWSNSQTTSTINNLSAGSYSVTVTDAIGCQGTGTAVITGPTASLAAQLTNLEDVRCFGAMDGEITITPTGGTAPYDVLWSNGSTATQITNLDTGIYTVTVTDAHGCTDTATIAITQPEELLVTAQALSHSCANEKEGSASTMATGGTTPYTYNWNSTPPQTSLTANGLAPGNYTVTVTDANSCTATSTITIDAYPLPQVSAGEDKVYCYGKEGVQLHATGAISYIWTPANGLNDAGIANPIAAPEGTTTYTVTGTDSMGCTNTDAVTVTVLSEQPMSAGAALHICEGDEARLHASGGGSYLWSPAEGLSDATIADPIVTAPQNTTYTVIITQNECFADTLQQTVTIYPKPSINLGPDIKAFSGTTIILHADMSDASAISWSPADNLSCEDCTAPEVKVVNTITYTATATNEGCTASDDITITATCDGSELFIANTFTPNDDGNNDVFYPQSASQVRVNTFRVYDRWGEKVFERSNFASNDPQQGWDGSWKGKQLTPGIYVYYLELSCASGEKILLKGDVGIVK